MVTLKKLKEMDPSTIFAEGTSNELKIRWIAKRGGIHDWCIYYGPLNNSIDFIEKYGNKIFDKEKIKNFVPCDDEAFAMYRY